ncbi:MAG: hypothetical protein MHPDNHAH_02074 [Anaerolineales bacterium]|nr:hypothetical protein [Anaerolineales bacterium]WKZ48908.1 MAG: hypothetical protein QY306_06015 [Anaerolineales bacterium]
MTDDNHLDFEIEVVAKDTSEADLDEMTRNLLGELKDETFADARLVSVGPAPEGSKGDSMATLAMAGLPIVLTGAVEVIKSWATRGQARTVKFKGRGIEFEGSAEELQKILAGLDKGKKKK